MKKLIRVLLAFVVFLAPTLAYAGGCGYGYSSYYAPTYYPTYYQPTYDVKKYTVLEFVQPFFVGVRPEYITAPAAPAATTTTTPAPSACDAKIAAMEVRLQAAEARLLAALAGGGNNGAAGATPTPVVSPPVNAAPRPQAQALPQGQSILAGNRCATCHDLRVAAERGHDLVLSRDGKLVPLTDQQIGAIMVQTTTKRMPKGKDSLTQPEFDRLLDELTQIAATAKK